MTPMTSAAAGLSHRLGCSVQRYSQRDQLSTVAVRCYYHMIVWSFRILSVFVVHHCRLPDGVGVVCAQDAIDNTQCHCEGAQDHDNHDNPSLNGLSNGTSFTKKVYVWVLRGIIVPLWSFVLWRRRSCQLSTRNNHWSRKCRIRTLCPYSDAKRTCATRLLGR